jgi:hypothetical protein
LVVGRRSAFRPLHGNLQEFQTRFISRARTSARLRNHSISFLTIEVHPNILGFAMCKPALWALCVAVALVAPSVAFAGGTYHHAEWVPIKSTDAAVESQHPVKHHLSRLTSRTLTPASQKIAARKHKSTTRTVFARRPAPTPPHPFDEIAAGRGRHNGAMITARVCRCGQQSRR